MSTGRGRRRTSSPAEALESIHAAGVVHRDLKPSNVLLGADGPRVIDFGISVAVEGSKLTRTGVAVGTPGFISPEQLTGAPVGPAGDVFCLGAVLAFAATATGPFGGGSWQGLWYRTVHEEPDLAALPPRLRSLVGRCLAKAPEERPTATALLDELAGNVAGGGRLAELYVEARWLPAPVAQVVRTLVATPAPLPPPEPDDAATPETAAASTAAAEGRTVADAPEVRPPGSPLRAAAAAAAARRGAATAARPSGQNTMSARNTMSAQNTMSGRSAPTRPAAHAHKKTLYHRSPLAEQALRRVRSRTTMLIMIAIPLVMLAVAIADALTG
ncbi:hypothetical protein GCM10022224_046640 [Nonomuraea antimicrobica]|uniref:non-specific serine/threonine protein kinase n=1 Tax=Nonomuraea antimicrobica TaxID=561173 RepID=A0ABP7C4K4_9ACTN